MRRVGREIRIGTRQSQLALWQAKKVQQGLEKLGYDTRLVQVTSKGDKNQKTPIYEMGIVGVFTKTLDAALLRNEIDIAVHSMKDVPTVLPEGIVQAAVLPRGDTADIIVTSGKIDFDKRCTIATSSLRRKAQWLHRYPHHQVVPLRGNVNTRLRKLETEGWEGAIFAKAGLERIHILPDTYQELDWMLPAPAQGAIVISARAQNREIIEASERLNHKVTEQTTFVERQFLRELEGGCSAPIGALAVVDGHEIHFYGNLFSLDGKTAYSVVETCALKEYKILARKAAQKIFERGGKSLIKEIHKVTNRM